MEKPSGEYDGGAVGSDVDPSVQRYLDRLYSLYAAEEDNPDAQKHNVKHILMQMHGGSTKTDDSGYGWYIGPEKV